MVIKGLLALGGQGDYGRQARYAPDAPGNLWTPLDLLPCASSGRRAESREQQQVALFQDKRIGALFAAKCLPGFESRQWR